MTKTETDEAIRILDNAGREWRSRYEAEGYRFSEKHWFHEAGSGDNEAWFDAVMVRTTTQKQENVKVILDVQFDFPNMHVAGKTYDTTSPESLAAAVTALADLMGKHTTRAIGAT